MARRANRNSAAWRQRDIKRRIAQEERQISRERKREGEWDGKATYVCPECEDVAKLPVGDVWCHECRIPLMRMFVGTGDGYKRNPAIAEYRRQHPRTYPPCPEGWTEVRTPESILRYNLPAINRIRANAGLEAVRELGPVR